MKKRKFILQPEHIALLRQAWVGWDDTETGAPCIDPKRPYGNNDVADDVADITDLGGATGESLLALHRQTDTALQIVLSTGSFEPGLYENQPYTNKWSKVDG